MSYSLSNLCWKCKKEKTCTDRVDIQDAIQKIHSKEYEEGHQGAGMIYLSCQNIKTFELDEIIETNV